MIPEAAPHGGYTGVIYYDQSGPTPFKRESPLKILADGANSYLRLPGYCAPCDVYGAEWEPECWNCGAYYLKRKTAPSFGGACSPTPANETVYAHLQDYLRNTPDDKPLEGYITNGTSSPTTTSAAPPEWVDPSGILQYWGGTPHWQDA